MKILIDNGHGCNTLGKSSPDKRLKEYAWTREIAKKLELALTKQGYDAERIVTEDIDVTANERIRRINAVCKKYGAENVLLVSIHNNASNNNGQWGTAKGFSVYVSKNASDMSRACASIFTEQAMSYDLIGNRSVPACKYWTWDWTSSDIAILKYSHCPAVLTENMFMDHPDDCNYLLSEEGKNAIIQLHLNAIQKYINLI